MNSKTAIDSVASDACETDQTIFEQKGLQEIVAWANLGNRAEARQLAEAFLARQESHAVRGLAMELAMCDDDLPAATHHALRIYRHHPGAWKGRKNLPVVLGYAGYAQEAYAVALECHRATPGSFSCYNLACKAWAVGHREEAFRAALQVFSCEGLDNDCVRKMFLDTELRGVWSYAAKRKATVADALRWAHCPLESIVQINLPIMPPRQVDFADLSGISPEFRMLLRQQTSTTKVVDPGKARANPELFQKYMKREAETCLPAIGCLLVWSLRLRKCYDEAVPAMVQFCANRGRPGAARYLLRQFLRRNPETSPDSFAEITGLEYWTDEWRRLRQIDPKGTTFLINQRPSHHDFEDFQEGFSSLPQELRQSGLSWMVLGCKLTSLQKYQEALEAFRSALAFWPSDEYLHQNVLLCLCRLGRWEEAETISAHPEFHAATPGLADFVRKAVAERRPDFQPPNPQSRSPFPTPSLDMTDQREDVLFLREFLHLRAVFNRGEP